MDGWRCPPPGARRSERVQFHESALMRDGTASSQRVGDRVPARRLLGQVVAAERLGSLVRLSLDVPGWSGAEPGQFALLQAEPSRCFLSRAVSVCDQMGEKVHFLIAPVGDGTRELGALDPGDAVRVTGPLGRGFDVDALAAGQGRTVLVAGGVGAAPFPLLLTRLAERHSAAGDTDPGPEVLVLLGFRDHDQSRGAKPLEEAALRAKAAGLRCTLEIATEDGSRGAVGKVTDLVERHLRPGDRLAVCGPEAMAAAVWRTCSRTPGVHTWFSLESNIACGVGSCHGCVVELADGSYARVCHEGPVFSGKEIFGG